VTIALIVLGIALAISLAFNLGLIGGGASRPSSSAAPSTSSSPARLEARGDDERARKAEADLDKKKKELEDVKKAQHELKEELKAVKKKLHEHREAHKAGDDLAKERAEVERHASMQLDATRAELAAALAEVARLKADADNKGKKRAAAPEEKKDEPKAEKPQEVVTRVIRELSDVEKERIAKLETQSAADRKKANELDRELKSLKAKLDRHQRDSKRVYQEADLARDKFRAVEVRLNRTLLENDLLKRAIKDLEKKSGQHAERLELTAEELAEGDKSMKARHAAEDAAEAEARAKLEAAPPTTPEGDEAPAAEAAAPAAESAPAATATPPAQA
jgi:chromosome segregation ATPase